MDECNCPMCTKTSMEDGKVYRCKNGGIMGVMPLNGSLLPSIEVLKKIANSDFANEQANSDIDSQIRDCFR